MRQTSRPASDSSQVLRRDETQVRARQPEYVVDCHGVTDRGHVRPRNEDQFLIAHLAHAMHVQQASIRTNGYSWWRGPVRAMMFAVADGMGGHARGDLASAVAIEAMARSMLRVSPHAVEDAVLRDLFAGMQTAERRVRQVAREEGLQAARMGTTLTVAYVAWPELYVAHVGDSRCYLLRGEQLEQITRDHTLAEQMRSLAVLEDGERPAPALDHVLVNAIGADDRPARPELHMRPLQKGDTILLCSDGLTRMLGDDVIGAFLRSEQTAEQACAELLRTAKDAGGEDNITAVIARF